MRIGIITHHYVANYGAFLQAYALQKAVERLCPEDEVYVVDRVNARHKAINALGWLRRAGGWRMPGVFARERRRCLRLSPRAGSADRLNEMGFDALIVGSDEVWNLADRKSFDPVKYGVGLRGALIAYAPSAGQTRADALGGEVKKGIMRFEHLSARDDAAARLIEAAGREAVHVLDPVFLCPPPWVGETGEGGAKAGRRKSGRRGEGRAVCAGLCRRGLASRREGIDRPVGAGKAYAPVGGSDGPDAVCVDGPVWRVGLRRNRQLSRRGALHPRA